MNPFHERLAHVALAAAGTYGFALAGGYAVQAAGFLDRFSEDIDLFTSSARCSEFDEAVEAIVAAYAADGLDIDVNKRFDTFARLIVTDRRSSETSKVELAVDWRANDPIMMAVGPVLHPDDAVANKMGALFGRVQARDFVDVDAAYRSGRYGREELLRLAEAADSGFDRRMFADAIGEAARIPADAFARYGVSGRDLDDLRTRFADWRAEILGR